MIGIGFELRGNSLNYSNVNYRRSGGSNIVINCKKKKTQKAEMKMDDPHWFLEKKDVSGRQISSQRNNRIRKISSGGTQWEGNGVGTHASPDILKDILLSSGWLVVSYEGLNTPIYLSPWGSSYGSLPQAFNAFSWDLSPSVSNGGCQSGSLSFSHEFRSSVSKTGGDAYDVQKKKVKQQGSRTLIDSSVLKKNTLLPRKHEFDKHIAVEETNTKELLGDIVSHAVHEKENAYVKDEDLNHETENSDCYIIAVRKTDDRNNSLMHLRRSARINGKHVPVDFDREDYAPYKKSSICVAKESALLPDAMQFREVHKLEASCMVEEKSNCCRTDAVKINQIGSREMHHVGEFLEVHEVLASSLVNEKAKSCYKDECSSHKVNDSDFCKVELETHKSSCSDKEVNTAKVLCNVEAVRIVQNSANEVGLDLDYHDLEVEKIEQKTKSEICTDSYHHKVESIEIEQNSENEVGDVSEYYKVKAIKIEKNSKSNERQHGKSVGVRRRSMRLVSIHRKHVPLESELDIEMVAYSHCLHPSSECVANKLKENTRDKPIFPIIKFNKMEHQSPILNETSVKEIIGEKVGNTQDLEGEGTPTKNDGCSKGSDQVKIPVSCKCSPSLKRSKTKNLVCEKVSTSSTKKRMALSGGNSNGKKKKKWSGGCRLTVRRFVRYDNQEKVSSEAKVTILSWLIDAGILTENEKIEHKGGNCRSMLKGCLTRGGIQCNCCKRVVTLLDFEAHAGSDLQQPWENIHLSSGKSLMQCWSEAWDREKKQRKVGFQMVGTNDPDPSDDSCGVCGDGGSLICCDNCPSTFHQDCLMLQVLPEGSWYCPYCRCAFCIIDEQGKARVSGSFILLKCNQCGRRYHRECAWGHDMLRMGSVSSYFCGRNCNKVAAGLHEKLGVSNSMEGGYSWTLLRRLDEDQGITSSLKKSFVMECNMKLCLALAVLDECFVPLLDPRTGLDMISQAIYNSGSNYSRLNYERFYTAILMKDEEIISVATLRLHGTQLAEMPFIGTRPMYRQQGMCRRLLRAIEDMLCFLSVEKLIIPAIPDMLETWIKSFSFKPLEPSHKAEIRNFSLLVFAGTTLLQKPMFNAEMKDMKDDINYLS